MQALLNDALVKLEVHAKIHQDLARSLVQNADAAQEKGAAAESELRALCEDVLANLPRSHTEPRKSKVAMRQAAQFEKMVSTECVTRVLGTMFTTTGLTSEPRWLEG